VSDGSGALFLNCTTFKGGAIQKKAGTYSTTRPDVYRDYEGARPNQNTFNFY